MNQIHKKKILIAEDDDNMRSALTSHFIAEQFEVSSASDGEIALDIAQKDHPDIILLDVMMPGQDGVSVMKTIRKVDDWGKNVPIILLTSLFEEDDVMQRVHKEDRVEYGLKDGLSLAEITRKVREQLDGIR